MRSGGKWKIRIRTKVRERNKKERRKWKKGWKRMKRKRRRRMRDIHPCHCWTITSVTLRTEAEFLWLGIPNCVLLYGIARHCIYILYGIARAASPIGNLNPLASSYSNVTPLLMLPVLPLAFSTARPWSLMLKIKTNKYIWSKSMGANVKK